ncbi:TRAP transporter large permease [Desulfofustis glycolicus]|uniref:TRAP transporter, DctM subunit n=1 Tax=Desulfofustis glycolicus DSM 9705 TaxID=1121409 RepID=A0A1M5YGV8_9BACT|nr:TRAP transporter large permease subunit [Desulfofustis glycolicus]MCB2217794.1 TRAP transporter large permease subunit [Desulfobulbaceae bacterium]SHI11277.1 TRAP transporter, DctM subunit [Desulfofustis glycolicus DSM 9705]
MTPVEALSIVGIIFLVVLLLGHPLAFTLGGLSVLFAATLWGNVAALNLFMRTTTSICTNIVYVAVPLFIFMGTILERSGAAEDLFESMYIVLGRIRGGLAIATVVICTLLAAASGIIGASLTLMTLLALPSMIKYNYDRDLATGTIMASGCLGTIIPPSIILVIYGAQAQISIGKLFAGGIGPGLLLSGLYLAYIIIRVWVKPDSAPAIDPEEAAKFSTNQKIIMVLKSVLPTLGLIFLVLGSIILGWATPTEAAALGCTGAILIAIFNKRLSWAMIKECCYLTMRTNAMIMWIILGASMFTAVFLGLGGGDLISQMVNNLEISRWLVMIFILFLLLVMGMFIDCYGVLLIGIPVFTPIVDQLGFDPLWFAIMFAVMIQASYLSPPFAYAAFYVKGVAKESNIDIPIGQLYFATGTFLLLQMLALLIMCFFPGIITWLPAKIY